MADKRVGRPPKVDPLQRVLDELDGMTVQQRNDWLTFVTRWVQQLNRRAAVPTGPAEVPEQIALKEPAA